MTKGRVPLDVAEAMARRVRAALLDHDFPDAFSRVEIAGSVRRGSPTVGDIELVGEIDPERDFGATERVKAALARMGVRRADPTVRKDGVEVSAPWGEKYLKGLLNYNDQYAVQLDLFVVRPPAEWGVIFLIRTGSAKFSEAMVTRLHRFRLKSEGGRIWQTHATANDTPPPVAAPVPCPTEEDFFRLARVPFIPPNQRDMNLPETARAFGGGGT